MSHVVRKLKEILAAAGDRKYLEQLNFKQLQKGRKPDGENPKEFYKKLQDDAKSGPLFGTDTLDLVEGLPELPKPVTKWIANLTVKDKLDDIKPKELGLIIDWINKSTDGTKLQNMTCNEAVKAQHEWQNSEPTEALGEYVTNDVVMRLAGGYKIVRIQNVEDLHTEGKIMQNCLKEGRYDAGVEGGTTKIYSLRDSSNEPHASMEVTDGEMKQCLGKQNETPVAKYHPALIEFFNKLKYFEGYLLIDQEIPEDKIEYVLQHGSGQAYETVIMSIAKNPSTDASVLANLAENSNVWVRARVAKNPNTDTHTCISSKRHRRGCSYLGSSEQTHPW